MIKSLTSGKPLKLLIAFTMPILIGNLFQQLYSMVDTLIVGRTIGINALAAVGSTGGLSFLVIGFVEGLTCGFTVITAQFFGAKDFDNVRKSVATSIILSVIASVIITLVSALCAKPLLRLMNTPTAIFDDAYNYIVVIFYGIGATVFYNLFSSIIRALGDSKTPLYFLILASVINVALDLLFIIKFKMGVGGAAWATVISQAFAGLLCVIYMFKKFDILHLKKHNWAMNWRFSWNHLRIGLPMAFQFSITAIGVLIVQSVLNAFGPITIAAYTAANKIENLATIPLFSLGTTAATYFAQNYGASEFDRIKKGMNAILFICIAFFAIALFIVLVFGGMLTRLFVTDIPPEVMDSVVKQSKQFLLINGTSYFLLGCVFVYRNALQGIGKSLATVIAGVAELVMRGVSAIIFAKYWGYIGICMAGPIAWLGADIFLIAYYYYCQRKLLGQTHKPHIQPTNIDHDASNNELSNELKIAEDSAVKTAEHN